MVAGGKSFTEVSSYVRTMDEIHRKDQGLVIRGVITRNITVRARGAHILEAEVLKVGTPTLVLSALRLV